MEKRVLSFREFISESFIYEEETKVEGVVFVAASTSDTNVTDSLAKEMGVKKDVKYKITLKGGLDPLKGLSKEFTLLTLAEKKKDSITVTEAGKVSTGKDILNIGDKSINEKGTMDLSKSELEGNDLIIEASNNGILALYRIAGKYNKEEKRNDGITGFYKTSGLSLKNTKDYLINVEMGTKDQRKNEWVGAWSGVSNTSLMNTVYSEISAAVVQKAGGEIKDQMTQDYEVIKQKSTDHKKMAELINNDMVRLQNGMIKKKLLVNTTPIDLKQDLETFLSDSKIYTKSSSGKILFTELGISKFLEIVNKVVEYFSDSSRPKGFPEKMEVLLPKASEIIKKTFGEAGKQTPKTWIDHVQTPHTYSTVGTPSGKTGMQTVEFGEGKF
jgi:hypothetical protein